MENKEIIEGLGPNDEINISKVLYDKNTYITSKKFRFTSREIIFSIVFSFVASLALSFTYIILFIYYNDDPELSLVGYHLLGALIGFTIIVFLLRVFFKRAIEVFSVIFIALLFIVGFGLKILRAHHATVCKKHGGEWVSESSYNPKARDYRCYFTGAIPESLQKNTTFPNDFEVRIRQ